GPAVRQLEAALAPLDGAGERTPLVAEDLALEQGLGNGRAVDRDEGPAAARRELMHGARDELLAGPAVAGDEQRRVRRRRGLQRLAAVAGGDHVVAPGRQQLLKPPARAGLVLDHQEAPVPRQILLRRPLGRGRSTLGGLGRSARTRAWLPPRVGRGRGGRNPDLARRV